MWEGAWSRVRTPKLILQAKSKAVEASSCCKRNVYFQQACPLSEEMLSWPFLINDDRNPLKLSLPPM